MKKMENETPHDVLFKGGGSVNGKPFTCIADLFQQMGCTIISGYPDPNYEKPYENTLTKKQRRDRKKRNKLERQRRRA